MARQHGSHNLRVGQGCTLGNWESKSKTNKKGNKALCQTMRLHVCANSDKSGNTEKDVRFSRRLTCISDAFCISYLPLPNKSPQNLGLKTIQPYYFLMAVWASNSVLSRVVLLLASPGSCMWLLSLSGVTGLSAHSCAVTLAWLPSAGSSSQRG